MVHIFITGLPGTGKTSVRELLTRVDNSTTTISHGTTQKQYNYDCIDIPPQRLLRALQPYTRTKQEKPQYVVLMVIRKDRITQNIRNISKNVLNYLTNPNNPVILCVTGCDSVIDLDWYGLEENYKEFAKYDFIFGEDRVVSGCTISLQHIHPNFRHEFYERRVAFRNALDNKINYILNLKKAADVESQLALSNKNRSQPRRKAVQTTSVNLPPWLGGPRNIRPRGNQSRAETPKSENTKSQNQKQITRRQRRDPCRIL